MARPINPYRGGHSGRPLTAAIRRHLVNIGKQGGRAAGALRKAREAARWAAEAEGLEKPEIARICNRRGYENGWKTGRRYGHGRGFEEGYEAALLEVRRLVLQGAPALEALRAAGQVVKVA